MLQRRYDDSNPAARDLVADLQQVRVSADRWGEPGAELTLHFIFNSGVLPSEVSAGPVSAEVSAFLAKQRTWKEIAAELQKRSDPADRNVLYNASAQAWAALCKEPKGASAEVKAAVSSIVGEAWAADDYSVEMARACPNLDVDYVSETVEGDSG